MKWQTSNLTENSKEVQSVEEQLERLLSSPYFIHSRRLPSLLTFIVRQTLAGNSDQLKERTLGIEVFQRDLDYDPASDSIVRVTASELRKRIAQYYLEPGHEHELRIILQPGSYVPHFQSPESAHELAHASPTGGSHEASPPDDSAAKNRLHSHRTTLLAIVGSAVALIALTAGIAIYLLYQPNPSALDAFWSPVLNSPNPILFCMADQSKFPVLTLRNSANLNQKITLSSKLPTVVIGDLNPVVTIGDILQKHGRTFTIKGADATNLEDLENGPTIFIGAFDNAWTLRLTHALHYHFTNNASMTEFGITNGANSSKMRWKVNREQQISTNNYRDYGIVARFTDGMTGKMDVVAAGVGLGATIAAGEFLVNSKDMTQIMQHANGHKNMEAVISTQIINGEPGSPKLEAVYYW